MLTTDTINLIYSGLLITGGVIGYVKAGSVPSLVAGAGSGLVVLAFQHQQLPYRTLAIAGVAGLLTYVMGTRFARSHKVMPAGIMAVASAVTLVAQILRINKTGSFN